MFPFDQPPPTAFYLVLYLATLVLHVVPMNYVLAGSAYLAALGVWQAVTGRGVTGRESTGHSVIASVLRDWMPLALSVAITMGVAPLLFIQILYKESFYTANLLLFHRWMAILPVLIAAFYLLYLQKSPRLASRFRLRAVVAIGVVACFAFVAWSWTENHLLSTRGLEAWTEQYASGGWFYGDPELPPRLTLWCVGALPTLAMVVAWQARGRGDSSAARTLAGIALGGLAAAGLAALWYGLALPTEVRQAVLTNAGAYLAMAGVGAALQAYAWWRVWQSRGLAARRLVLATAGVALSTLGVTTARESRRLAAIDITELYDQHAQAATVGGLGVFLGFFVLNAALIAGVVVLLRRGRQAPAS